MNIKDLIKKELEEQTKETMKTMKMKDRDLDPPDDDDEDTDIPSPEFKKFGKLSKKDAEKGWGSGPKTEQEQPTNIKQSQDGGAKNVQQLLLFFKELYTDGEEVFKKFEVGEVKVLQNFLEVLMQAGASGDIHRGEIFGVLQQTAKRITKNMQSDNTNENLKKIVREEIKNRIAQNKEIDEGFLDRLKARVKGTMGSAGAAAKKGIAGALGGDVEYKGDDPAAKKQKIMMKTRVAKLQKKFDSLIKDFSNDAARLGLEQSELENLDTAVELFFAELKKITEPDAEAPSAAPSSPASPPPIPQSQPRARIQPRQTARQASGPGPEAAAPTRVQRQSRKAISNARRNRAFARRGRVTEDIMEKVVEKLLIDLNEES